MRSLLVAVVFLLAGCIASTPDDRPAEADPDAETASGTVRDDHPWSLQATACREAGGVAAYGMDFYTMAGHHVPAPWVLADIRDEVGGPLWGANGDPILGPATGHWHMAVVCDAVRFEGEDAGPLAFGWVGIEVEPPAWDHGGADRHVLLSGLSLPEGLRDGLESLGVPVTATQEAAVVELAPGTLYVLHDDASKGRYETWGPVLPYRDVDGRVVRLWMTVEAHGGQAPVWFDVTDTMFAQAVTGESAALGCHTETQMHGPQGGLCAFAAVILYDGFDRTLRYGGPADAVVPEAWHH